jgi:Domain of unknown function DUF11
MRPGLVGTAVLLLLGAIAPSAFAQPPPDGQGTDRFVTIAARECPEYTDITANRARNDIQESLRDLGADTSYVAGQPIDPEIEARDQPNCTPLPNWRFTLGTGIIERAVSGPWGSLSIVTGPFDTSIVTEDEVPLRDLGGRPTDPPNTIEGAVTIELTEEQAQLAAQASRLWIQGGTPADPILNVEFPDEFGFGALRCAVDNLNGDNVEYISYPQGTEHVFCFAYYVRPPPTSGTIIVRKVVSDPPNATESFQFDGNLSFNPGGRFDLSVQNGNPASQRFYRAETGSGEPWRVRELVPDGWTLTDLSCLSPGASTEVIDRQNATVAITLAARDIVTCTFTDAQRVPAGQLFIRKITRNGIGTFDFDVLPDGGGDPLSATATTTEPGLAADAEPSPLEVSPGTYTIRETLPRRRGGRWRLVSARCAAEALRRRSTRSVSVTIGDQEGKVCTFVNRFVPNGRIVIDKVTTGGVGTFGFLISPRADPERVFEQSATTQEPGRLTRARGDRLRRLRLGRYVIQELGPPDADDGTWSLRLVICDGRVVPAVEGRVTIRLTARDPVKRCGFLNVFDPADGPGPDPPGPDPPGPNPVPGGPDPDLVVTKQADRSVAGVGERVAYSITVRNRGPVAAEQVVLAEGSERGAAAASISGRASRRCGRVTNLRRPVGPVVVCRIGDLAAGASRTLRFETRLTQAAHGRLTNVAVVGSETPETDVRNNVAASRVRVRRGTRPPAVTG